MSWRRGISHPIGLTLLGCSVVLAALLAGLPAAGALSGRALTVLLVGIGFYVACVGVVALWPPSPPELARFRAARREIARLLGARQISVEIRPEWDLVVANAVVKLDEEISPALTQLLAQRDDLRRYLSTHDRSNEGAPDPASLERLRQIRVRQDTAIATCLQRVVNAEATLIERLQESLDTRLVERLRLWVENLAAANNAIVETLESSPPTSITAPETRLQPVAPMPPTEYPVGLAEQPALDEMVKTALQRLNKPATLASCELATRLPLTLQSVRLGWGAPEGSGATPLDQSHALRELLVGAIERLRAGDADATDQSLHYHVLREEYTLGMATKHIMVRHSISESTLHRRRLEGIRAIAAELILRERALAQRPDAITPDSLT